MTEQKPSRWQWFKCAANPLNSTAGYALPHLIVLIIIALAVFGIGFGAGWRAGTQYTAAYFQQRYAFPGLKTPPPGVSAPVRDIHRSGLSAQGSVRMGYYPSVGDQGPLGECAGYASAWAMSDEMRLSGRFGWIRLSPIFEYSYYSDRYSGGQDAGSWPDQDLELLQSTGLPRFKQVPTPPYQILNPLPTTDSTGAALRMVKAQYQIHYISGFSQGSGQGAVDAARSAISDGHPIMWALPVYPEYDKATQQPLITSPTAGETSRGGHANVLLRYDDSKVFPDGTVGGFLTQNQWGTQWGLGGRAWVSYDFIRRYSFGLEYITLGAAAPKTGHLPHYTPSHAPTHSIVPKDDHALTVPGATAWRVKNVYTHDTHVDLTAAFNYWGTRYNVWPVGMVAIAATESGINQYADRWGVWPDVSFGLSQFTVATANAYGVAGDSYAVRAYLNNPFNSIQLEARFLRDAEIATCLSFPTLYSAYNQGSGLGCNAYAYYHPSGQAAINYYGNWLGNYNYVLATYSDYGPPPAPPKPRPIVRCGKRTSLIFHRHGGYWQGNFWYCRSFTWPKYRWHKKTIVTWRTR